MLRLVKRECAKVLLAASMWLASTSMGWCSVRVEDAQLQNCLNDISQSRGWVDAEDFREVKCHSKGIRSLKGLEQLSALESLSLHNNKLKYVDIDLQRLSHLKTLNLARNQLKQFSLTSLSNITSIYLFGNDLQRVALSDLANLNILRVNNNVLLRFDYSGLPSLAKIYIFNNKLEFIDIYDLPALAYMDCRENPMSDELYDEMDQMRGVTFLHDGNAEDW